MSFKIGDKVKLIRNKNKLSDFECDLIMNLDDGSMSEKKYNACMDALYDEKRVFVIKDIESNGYVLSVTPKVDFPFLFEENYIVDA